MPAFSFESGAVDDITNPIADGMHGAFGEGGLIGRFRSFWEELVAVTF